MILNTLRCSLVARKSVDLSVAALNRTFQCELHLSVPLNSKTKRSPNKKHEMPHRLNTSWGRLVSRGMREVEPITEYTVKPQPVQKTGGRGVDGRREIGRIGGGVKVVWHMTDPNRITETEADPKIEIVKDIIPEQTRSGFIALVVGGEKKRWIIATENMKKGDIIKSTREIPTVPIQGEPGDCHPVGALTIGSSVCQVERHPYHGSKVANAAGGSIQIIKKLGDQVVLKMPSKQEMIIHENCLCVVGRVSNVDRKNRELGKAGAARQLGIRPKSGLWMRKTGVHGRKIKPSPRPLKFDEPHGPKPKVHTFTVDPHLFHVRKQGVRLWF